MSEGLTQWARDRDRAAEAVRAYLAGDTDGHLRNVGRQLVAIIERELAPPDVQAIQRRGEARSRWLWWIGKYAQSRVSRNDLYVVTQVALGSDPCPPPQRADETWMDWNEGVAHARAHWDSLLAAMSAGEPQR